MPSQASSSVIEAPPHGAAATTLARRIRAFCWNKAAVVGVVILLGVYAFSFVGPSFSPYTFDQLDALQRLQSPSSRHLLGTDELGRDILTRLMHGGRATITISLLTVGMALVIGSTLGAVSGFCGGRIDTVVMRFTDALMSIPVFVIILTVIAIMGRSEPLLVVLLGLTSWMGIARIVRSEFLRWKQEEFIVAARAVGAADARIILRHLLPQAVPSILVAAPLALARIILVESGLSFLGLGVQQPKPSWGNMLSNSQFYMWSAPILSIYPGCLIVITVMAYSFVGNGLRTALDPTLSS